MSQAKRTFNAPKKSHDGATITKNAAGEETDNSGQLSHVLIQDQNQKERKIKSVRDGHDAGMAAAIPVLHAGDCE